MNILLPSLAWILFRILSFILALPLISWSPTSVCPSYPSLHLIRILHLIVFIFGIVGRTAGDLYVSSLGHNCNGQPVGVNGHFVGLLVWEQSNNGVEKGRGEKVSSIEVILKRGMREKS